MATRTITGNVKDLTDSAVASGTVTFEKMTTSTTGNTIHQWGVTTATTDGSGDFSIALSVPASGSYRYKMTLPNSVSFYFSIAAGASVNVATLIIAETITDSDAIVEALAAYLPLSGGTMTGQLNFSGTTHAGIKLLSLTTTQRDALTPANGMAIYNSTTTTIQGYQNGAWVTIANTTDLAAYLPLAGGTMSGGVVMADQLLTRPVIKDYGETVNAIGSTGGGTQDIDLTLGNVVSATVDTSANTFTFSNPSASGTACSFTLILTNGGSQTVNWPASVDWAGGTAPTLTAAGVDILTFSTIDGGTIWYGFAAGLDMS